MALAVAIVIVILGRGEKREGKIKVVKLLVRAFLLLEILRMSRGYVQ